MVSDAIISVYKYDHYFFSIYILYFETVMQCFRFGCRWDRIAVVASDDDKRVKIFHQALSIHITDCKHTTTTTNTKKKTLFSIYSSTIFGFRCYALIRMVFSSFFQISHHSDFFIPFLWSNLSVIIQSRRCTCVRYNQTLAAIGNSEYAYIGSNSNIATNKTNFS